MTTTDLSKFGYRELEILGYTLAAMQKGLPADFDNEDVHPMFNMNSGNVFLTNSSYQVAMLNGDDLESFYSCPECGHEGFRDEIEHGDERCHEWLNSLFEVAA